MLWCKTCGVRLARLELVPAIRVTREFPVIEATSVLAVDGSRHLKLETTMSADPDSCLPTPVKNFVFDLHDTSFRSQILSEQAALYNGTFRDLSSKVCCCMCDMSRIANPILAQVSHLGQSYLIFLVSDFVSILKSLLGPPLRQSRENVTTTRSS